MTNPSPSAGSVLVERNVLIAARRAIDPVIQFKLAEILDELLTAAPAPVLVIELDQKIAAPLTKGDRG